MSRRHGFIKLNVAVTFPLISLPVLRHGADAEESKGVRGVDAKRNQTVLPARCKVA